MTNSWSMLYDEILKMDEIIDDGMRPWGHSDYELLINNPNMTAISINSVTLKINFGWSNKIKNNIGRNIINLFN